LNLFQVISRGRKGNSSGFDPDKHEAKRMSPKNRLLQTFRRPAQCNFRVITLSSMMAPPPPLLSALRMSAEESIPRIALAYRQRGFNLEYDGQPSGTSEM